MNVIPKRLKIEELAIKEFPLPNKLHVTDIRKFQQYSLSVILVWKS